MNRRRMVMASAGSRVPVARHRPGICARARARDWRTCPRSCSAHSCSMCVNVISASRAMKRHPACVRVGEGAEQLDVREALILEVVERAFGIGIAVEIEVEPRRRPARSSGRSSAMKRSSRSR